MGKALSEQESHIARIGASRSFDFKQGLFNLNRIASLGKIFYIVMDIAVHWGVLRHLRADVKANPLILISAISLDVIVLGAFIVVKAQTDTLVVVISLLAMLLIFICAKLFLNSKARENTQ